MTRRPPPQRPRDLLKSPSRCNALGLLDASLQSTDLELARGHVRGDIQLAGRGERGVGRLGGEGAGIKGFGTFAVGGGLEVRRLFALVGRGYSSHGDVQCLYVMYFVCVGVYVGAVVKIRLAQTGLARIGGQEL